MELGEWVTVDPQAAKPLFDQLRTQIIDSVRDGKLQPGTRLPTVRELAGQLGLAVNTIARAYRDAWLELTGQLPLGPHHLKDLGVTIEFGVPENP